MTSILNSHVIDPHNIGDLISAPLYYFSFPDFKIEFSDIRHIKPEETIGKHIIIGGGGLFFKRFKEQIKQLVEAPGRQKIIAWGVGQQVYGKSNYGAHALSDVLDYLDKFDLVGIRDSNTQYPWVPCASCMHAAFYKQRDIQHEYVVFSHKKFQIHIDGFPRMTNEVQDFEQVLDFLASGETILTSSFHGAYWGTLLGRKVLAFPFSSKFYTLKHLPGLYPVQQWQQDSRSFKLFGKTLYTFQYRNRYSCHINNWQNILHTCNKYVDSLYECRHANQEFYKKVSSILAE